MHELPDGVELRTRRCLIRPAQLDDLNDIVALHSDAKVREFLGAARPEEEVRARFEDCLAGFTRELRWVLQSLAGDCLIGELTVGPHHDEPDLEVSYLLLPGWWGQGYAFEALRALIDHLLLECGLCRLIAETQAANLRSCRLLERLGMKRERQLRRFGAEQVLFSVAA